MPVKEKEMKFEEALDKLEKTVQKLESGDLTLDQAIKTFEEGTELRKFCEEKLKETERKVEMIIKNKISSDPSKKLPVKDFKDGSDKDQGEDPLL
jgi:exodeoxyribonuclease VII small subunit